MKRLSDSGRPALYLCNPRKNTECRKNRCVFDGRRRCGLQKGCNRTADARFAVLDGAGKPLTVPDGAGDYEELLRRIEAECRGRAPEA